MVSLLLILVCGLAVSVGGAVTYLWISGTDAWALLDAHQSSLALAAVVAMGLTLANLLLRWLRWNFLLRRFHVRIATRDTFRLFFGTLAAIMTPLYLGELVRGAIVARRERALGPVMFWVWLVERVSDAAALLCIWGVCGGSAWMLGLGTLLLVLAPGLLARRSLRSPDAPALHTGQLRAVWTVSFCATASLIAWLLPAFALYAIAQALGVRPSLSAASEVFAKGTLLGGFSGSPGGLGTTGSAMIVSWLDAGVNVSAASASVLVLRFSTQWFATALGVVLLWVWRVPLARLLASSFQQQAHFDELAPSYANDIPEHYRDCMLQRKVGAMLPLLQKSGAEEPLRGLDLGCGQGWYAAELASHGYAMHGVDLSSGQIEEARRYCEVRDGSVALQAYDGVHLPYPDGFFDFAYSINVLHHVTDPTAQRALLAEALRVIKPGAPFMLHEMNVENPVFRGYVSYVFPLLKSIDEGTELWIRPSHLPLVPTGKWQRDIAYFTFLPEFLPGKLLTALQPVERWLESSRLRHYSAHYMATLRRQKQP